MARIVALAQLRFRTAGSEWLRALAVAGCALALILARTSLPL